MAIAPEQVADAMFEMVEEYQGKKKLKAGDLTKAMGEKFGKGECDRKVCKAAIRILIDSGRCIYTYWGGSYVELPQDEPTAADGSTTA